FEIGNHTRDHLGITDKTLDRLDEQLTGIEEQCLAHGIPKPVTFAWPGNAFSVQALATLQKHGIQFARRGGSPEYPYEAGRGIAFEPGSDHPLLVPTAGDARPTWTLPDLIRAVEQARDGRIAVLQFHGVPDTAHSWVSLDQSDFEGLMKYLSLNKYKVIAMRDLEQYIDPTVAPDHPLEIIEVRKKKIEEQESRRNDRGELRE
ncbi:MAG: polysaccharide deacetylase family protein, partial [Planctomycetaceae bacterium]|nr:polysaccharide deacetylase family protein [Planctomycetaceae bacterium]